MPLGTEVGFGPGDIVLDWVQLPLAKKSTVPNFRPVFIVAKRSPISATAELLLDLGLPIIISETVKLGISNLLCRLKLTRPSARIIDYPRRGCVTQGITQGV